LTQIKVHVAAIVEKGRDGTALADRHGPRCPVVDVKHN
jgi:hypothetical protein